MSTYMQVMGADINKSYVDINKSHVDINKLHANINKLQSYLHVYTMTLQKGNINLSP